MSEEEKKAIEYLENRLDILHNNTQWATEESIKVVLSLIKKQQKEIEKYKNVIDNRDFTWKQKYEETFEYVKEEFISKDKIREIIDIYDNTHEQYVELPNGKVIDRNCCGYLIEYLEELLEE